MTPRLSVIHFTSHIDRLTKGFTGQQWVFDELDVWLKESEKRFFVLIGEPGAGRSAIAARLTQNRQDIFAAYHFCIFTTILPEQTQRFEACIQEAVDILCQNINTRKLTSLAANIKEAVLLQIIQSLIIKIPSTNSVE